MMLEPLGRYRRLWASAIGMARNQLQCWVSRRPVTDPRGDSVVSLTTYGRRASFVHLSIESIAGGDTLPARLILWVDEAAVLNDLPRGLRRQAKRGLEILPTNNYGPHKKYFPYALSTQRHTRPLVTADDDALYPRRWLKLLVAAAEDAPGSVICHRAREVRMEEGGIAPYNSWAPTRITGKSFRTFPIGVAGVLYPAAFLDWLRDAGNEFVRVAPRADDIWLHAQAVRGGFPATCLGLIGDDEYVGIRGAREIGLEAYNVTANGNDVQADAAYSDADRERLRAATGPC